MSFHTVPSAWHRAFKDAPDNSARVQLYTQSTCDVKEKRCFSEARYPWVQTRNNEKHKLEILPTLRIAFKGWRIALELAGVQEEDVLAEKHYVTHKKTRGFLDFLRAAMERACCGFLHAMRCSDCVLARNHRNFV